MRFEGPDGQTLEAGFARVVDSAGLDWSVVVAVPRADFMAGVSANVARTVIAGLLAAALAVGLAMFIVRWVARDVERLADAARRVGQGDLDTPLGFQRTSELGELAQAFSEMQYKLRTDRLTGLANREAVMQRLKERMKSHRRTADAEGLAVLFVDLDRFKTVNDRFGHEAGDTVLSTMGLRLRKSVRDHDMVARWAGDEFIVLVDSVPDMRVAEQVRAQLEAALREPVEVHPGQPGVVLGGSVGLALYLGDASEPADLIRAADSDMYRRKPVGNTVI
jgi:diguanylate cyclase (GGDEF)-like protein